MQWKQYWTIYKGRKPTPEDYVFYGRKEGTHQTTRSFMDALDKATEKGENLLEHLVIVLEELS